MKQARVTNGSMPVVRSVERALAILASLGENDLRLGELAERLSLHKATVTRLLGSLTRAGFVERDDRDRYFLGPAVLRLATRQMTGYRDLVEVLHEPLRRLNRTTGETVTVHVRVGTDRVVIDEIPSSQPIAYRAGVGHRASLHIGSAGKVLLAFLPDDERAALLKQLQLTAVTERSITGQNQLKSELAKVRRQGYAFSSGERVIGASAVSVPVFDFEGRLLATVSVLAPDSRLPVRQQRRFAALLTREVPRLPISLGPRDPSMSAARG